MFGRSILIKSSVGFNICGIQKQIDNIPEFWKSRMESDYWRIYLMDKIPKEYEENSIKFRNEYNILSSSDKEKIKYISNEDKTIYVSNIDKTVYVKFTDENMKAKCIYLAYAYYIYFKYFNENISNQFEKIINKEMFNLDFFLEEMSNKKSDMLTIFTELFAFVILTQSKNTHLSLEEQYEFVRKWVYIR